MGSYKVPDITALSSTAFFVSPCDIGFTFQLTYKSMP